jgi:hypothetical protein
MGIQLQHFMHVQVHDDNSGRGSHSGSYILNELNIGAEFQTNGCFAGGAITKMVVLQCSGKLSTGGIREICGGRSSCGWIALIRHWDEF